MGASAKHVREEALGEEFHRKNVPIWALIGILLLLVLIPEASHFRQETLRNYEDGLSIQARTSFD